MNNNINKQTTEANLDMEILVKNYYDFMEHNNRAAQISAYSLAFLGFAVAMRKVRPFNKFSKSSQIPNSFIKKRIEITGKVNGIDPKHTSLMIDHKPLITLPFVSKRLLPVKIANVEVSGLGINWLQTIVTGNEVVIVPISKHPEYLLSEVMLPQKEKDSKKINLINVGETLMAIGFGKFEQNPLKVNGVMHKIYIDKLKYAEENATKSKLGFRYYSKPILTFFLWFLKSSFWLTIRMLSKTLKSVPKLVMRQRKVIT